MIERKPTSTKMLLFFAAIVYPSWYFLYQWVDSVVIEVFWYRLIVTFVALAGYLAIDISVRMRHRHKTILNFVAVTMLCHFHFFLISNNLKISLIIGAALTFACCAITTADKLSHILISVCTFFCILVTCLVTTAPVEIKFFYVISISTLWVVVHLVLMDRFDTFKYIMTAQRHQKIVLDSLSDGVFLYTSDGSIEIFNSAACYLLGISNKIHFLPYHDLADKLVNENLQPTKNNIFENSIENNRVIVKEVLGIKKNESEIRWVSVNCVPIDSFGTQKQKAVVVSMTDITSVKLANEQLNLNREKMVFSSKMAALGEMAGGVAHEINNPLAIINVLAQQMAKNASSKKPDPSTIVQMSQKIVLTVDRVAKIVKGLKSFSRDDKSDVMETVSVKDLVEDTLSYCNETFKNRNIEIDLSGIDPQLQFACHRTQISQIILNLLQNSRDALEACETKKVWISAQRKANHVEFRIADNGPGIPLEIRSKIMNAFFTTKSSGKGTGLGLSISKRIASEHGGEFYLDESAQNTTFVLSLPIEQALQKIS